MALFTARQVGGVVCCCFLYSCLFLTVQFSTALFVCWFSVCWPGPARLGVWSLGVQSPLTHTYTSIPKTGFCVL